MEVGAIYEGKVVRLMDFGAFVQILPGKDGLVHISQISDERVERVSAEGEDPRHLYRDMLHFGLRHADQSRNSWSSAYRDVGGISIRST